MEWTLKQYRLAKEVTQEKMAAALNVHVQTYRKIEANPEKATIEQGKKICGVLGIPYDAIFFGCNSSLTRYNPQENKSA